MKKLMFMAGAMLALALSVAVSPASADAPFFAGRGWVEGVHRVAYSVNGDMRYITAADLAAAGVSIFDQGAVFAYLSLQGQNFGGCGAAPRDPDGGCYLDNGVSGTVSGPELQRNDY